MPSFDSVAFGATWLLDVLLFEDIDVTAVIAHCRENLADFKVPQYVSLVSEALPRNAGGKLLKNRLREQVVWGPALR